MKVTVIVSTKNRLSLLKRALGSLQVQTFEDWECVVLNDGGESVTALTQTDDRFRELSLPRSIGPYPARNIGLRVAKGEYITYLDDDDWLDAHHLTRLVEKLDAGTRVAYTDSRRVFEVRQNDTWAVSKIQEPYHARDFDRNALLVDNFIPILAIMHRRDCVDSTGLFDEDLPVLGDWEMWLRMSQEFLFHRVPGVSCSVRHRNDHSSITTGHRQHHYRVVRTIYDRYEAPADLFVPRARILTAFAKEHEALA